MLTAEQRAKLAGLPSYLISDAMDALGFTGAAQGIRPLWEGCPKLVGEAVTVKLGPTGEAAHQDSPLCSEAIRTAKPGDVIVVDNHGDTNAASWEALPASSAQAKGIAGVVVDGAARGLDHFMSTGFPVYARSTAVRSPRGHVMDYETNGMIQFGNVQVRPGDVVVGDHSGIVILPQERLGDVIAKAEELAAAEASRMQEAARHNVSVANSN